MISPKLGGGFKFQRCFVFFATSGEMILFDAHVFFEMG